MNLALRFSRNLVFILWARIFSVVANLAFLAVSARLLGVAGFGKLIFVLATTSFAEMAFSGGLDSIVVREQAQRPARAADTFIGSLAVQLCFSCIILFASAGLAAFFSADSTLSLGFLISGTASAIQILINIPIAFFRAEENMRYEAVLITLERTLFLIAFLGIVARGGNVVAILACLLFSVALKALVGYLWFLRRRGIGWSKQGLTRSVYLLKESFPLIGTALLFSMRWRVDLFVMRALGSAEQFGLYAASFRVLEMLRILPIDFISAAFPIFCKLAAQEDEALSRSYRGFLRAALIGGMFVSGLGLVYANPATLLFFGRSFAGAVPSLRLLILVFPMMFLSQLNNITLTATQRQKWLFYCLSIAVPFQIAIDILAIPRLGAVGAATGFLVGELCFLLATSLAVVPLSLKLRTSVSTAIRLLLASLLAFATASWASSRSAVLSVPLACVLYVLCLWLFGVVSRDDVMMVRELYNQAARRLWNKPAKLM